jgi:hypothetical protein
VDRPDEARRAALVAERLAQLPDQAGEARVRDVGRPPDPLLELRPRHGLGALPHEDLQEVEDLGRKVDELAVGVELPRPRVEREPVEDETLRHFRGS